MKKLIAVAVVALGTGIVTGHFAWPIRKTVQPTPQRLRVQCEKLAAADAPPTMQADAPEMWDLPRLQAATRTLAAAASMEDRYSQLRELTTHVGPEHVADLCAYAVTLPPGAGVQLLLQDLVSTWVREDPMAAMEFAKKLPSSRLNDDIIQAAFTGYAESDTDAAKAYIDTLPPGQLRQNLTATLIEAMATIEPTQALALAHTLPALQSDARVGMVFSQWALSDRDGALKAIERLPQGRDRVQAIESVSMEWASTDPEAALDWLAKHADSQSNAMSTALSIAANSNPKAAASYLARMDDSSRRDSAISEVAGRWAAADPTGAASWARALPPEERDLALSGIAENIYYQQPDEALAYVRDIEDPKVRGRNMCNVIGSIAEHDPERALTLANEMDESPEKTEALADVIARWSNQDPAAAARVLSAITDNEVAGSAVYNLGQAWATTDPKAATQWVSGITDEETRKRAAATVASTWAGQDPSAAADWAEKQSDDDVVQEVVSSWMQRDPHAAADWALRRARSGNTAAIERLVGVWNSTDEKRANAWAKSLPSGNVRDVVMAELGSVRSYQDPKSAIAYTLEISDPQRRSEALGEVYRVWSARDDDAAQRWLAAASLSDSERKALTAPEPTPENDVRDSSNCVCPPVIQ